MFNTIATKGTQGVHTYFTATMRWGELDHVLVFPEQLGDLDEDEQMQRGLAKKRIGDLVEYLDEPDHFFSALTLIIMPRDLSHPAHEGEVRHGADFQFVPLDPEELPVTSQELGALYLSGDVRLFPADGQHRSRSALHAMKDDPSLSKEEVPVVLIAFKNYDQVRQLFADLNLNAKPVSKTTGLGFESRNPQVVAIKKAAEQVPLFQGRVNKRSNSLPGTSNQVITLSTMDAGSEEIVTELAKRSYLDSGHTVAPDGWDKETIKEAKGAFFKHQDTAVAAIANVWTTITDLFPDQRDEILTGVKTPGEIRDEYLFALGLGQRGLALATAQLMADFPNDWETRLRAAVAKFDWKKDAAVWNGNAVIHGTDRKGNPNWRVNNTGPAIIDLADRIVQAAH